MASSEKSTACHKAWCPEEATNQSLVCRSNPPESMAPDSPLARKLRAEALEYIARELVALRKPTGRGGWYIDTTTLPELIDAAEYSLGGIDG